MICEVGAWKNYEELEEALTLDELFLTFEKIMERTKRQLEINGAMSGMLPSSSGSTESLSGGFSGPMKDVRKIAAEISGGQSSDLSQASDGDAMTYAPGPITHGNQTIIGYRVAGESD